MGPGHFVREAGRFGFDRAADDDSVGNVAVLLMVLLRGERSVVDHLSENLRRLVVVRGSRRRLLLLRGELSMADHHLSHNVRLRRRQLLLLLLLLLGSELCVVDQLLR